jgi:hypothetical protein
MRLNYAKVIPYIEYFTEKISHLISEDDDTPPELECIGQTEPPKDPKPEQ